MSLNEFEKDQHFIYHAEIKCNKRERVNRLALNIMLESNEIKHKKVKRLAFQIMLK